MSLIPDFLAEIDSYVEQRGIKETTFGRLAVNDGKFVGRLREGRGVTVALIERAQSFMRDNPPHASAVEREPHSATAAE